MFLMIGGSGCHVDVSGYDVGDSSCGCAGAGGGGVVIMPASVAMVGTAIVAIHG